MKIYLIRHGQTTGDLEDRYGGDYDDHLTEEGKAQARGLADKLKDSGIEIIFCSPKIRAQETAEIVSKKIKCKVEVVHGIRERNMYGFLTGMVKGEAREKYLEHVAALKDHHHAVPGSENYEHFSERVERTFKEISKQPYRTIAVISHGGVIGYVFREILKMGDVKINDCGFAELEDTNGHLSVVRLEGIKV